MRMQSQRRNGSLFLLTPLREGRPPAMLPNLVQIHYFYSRPCGRGDERSSVLGNAGRVISTHAPAGGATLFFSASLSHDMHFYSRPCGRGDAYLNGRHDVREQFLLTPLREGRLSTFAISPASCVISTHAPAGGATVTAHNTAAQAHAFLLTPLREGRPAPVPMAALGSEISTHAPAGGATGPRRNDRPQSPISTHAPAGGATGVHADAAG